MRTWCFCVGKVLAILLVGFVYPQPTAAQSGPGDIAAKKAAEERSKRMQELVAALVETHGYKLAEGEPFKYIKDPRNEEREQLRRLLVSSPGHGVFDPSIAKPLSEQNDDSFRPFRLVLHLLPDGKVASSTVSDGVVTLGDVLDNVLRLQPYELDCPLNVRMTYMPGDWVLHYEPNGESARSAAGAAALERILNEQCDLNMHVGWKMMERPALTIRGKYEPRPAGGRNGDEREAVLADGVFLVNVRRAVSYHPDAMVGDFEQFIDSVGYLLMLPVVNEAETTPAKRLVSWNEVGKAIEGSDRLKPEHEQRVLESLSIQTGYEFRVEPRKVQVFSIQPKE